MEEIQISTPLVWREAESERILIGKVLSNKTYTRATIEAILKKAWNLPEGFDVIEINGNAFMFKFTDKEEFNRVLRGRPWSINGFLLNLMERSTYKTCEEFDFSRCPVWIQMHNVPMEAWCLENAITIGGYVGEVVLAEDPCYNGRYLRGFLRARVLLNLKKPIACGFWMPRPDEKPRFGAWLTTNACRCWDEVMVVVRSDWSESEHARKKKEEAIKRKNEEVKRKSEEVPKADDDELFVIRIDKPLAVNRDWDLMKNKARRAPNAEENPNVDRKGLKQDMRNAGIAQPENQGVKERIHDSADVVGRVSMGTKANTVKALDDEIPCRSDKPCNSQEGNPMAMVVYGRRMLGDITNKIEVLGTKRNAVEEWETSRLRGLNQRK
ncbi:hypothetical protein K1719_018928 [Acacia pycnantha]|nr:hypothetical protein K1719_018928 [Acacia pycnantha]